MAHKKGAGSTQNIKDSPGQRLGVKVYGGQTVKTGNIIVRQRGMTKIAGLGARAGKDFTIFATQDGKVEYRQVKKTRFSGSRVPRTEVRVI
ncbi:MAG: 50S ribosomal protein L27 [Candidatus Saccharimonadales bacterium]